ncbi:MAG: DUF47 family protein [Lentisphaeria bacterium]|jgi:predicted phosphate transport protein (TIGR00153 family)
MFLASKRNAELHANIRRYLAAAGDTVGLMLEGLRHYTQHGVDAHFETLAAHSHTREADADAVRRQISIDLFAHSLLPDSREALLLLLERVDLIPNQAKDVLRMLLIQDIHMPPFTHGVLLELAETGDQAFHLVDDGITDLLGPRRQIGETTQKIDDAERIGDQLEQLLIAKLFRADLPLAEKILARDVIYATGHLCDFAQDVGMFITVISVSRHE